jgi:uncharacterized protein YbcI
MPADQGTASASTSLRNGISNAMARIKREFYGKGPARTRTYIFDNVVIAILEDLLTPVEHALKQGGRGDLVRRTRLTFEDIMTRSFIGEMQKLTEARVVAYHSQIVFEPDMAIEFFVLDRPVQAHAPAGEVESSRLAQPGAVGDADALPGPPDDRQALAKGSPARRHDGEMRAGIANAMVRLTHEYWGKGPTRAKAHIEDRFVFAILEDPLTTVERTLIEGGESHLVRELRLAFHELTHDDFTREVEKATGRRVLASHSQVVFDPDVLFVVFVLEDADAAHAVMSPAQADIRAADR